jgi:XTP/dITP diphosphohydrolase
LDGRPGVLSARYGGAVDWEDRRRMLLDEMAPFADRAARFVCHLHFIDENGNENATSGIVDGEICVEDRGAGGFSYDPIFFYPPMGRTFAELQIREKNAISHRARAVGRLLTTLDDSENEVLLNRG